MEILLNNSMPPALPECDQRKVTAARHELQSQPSEHVGAVAALITTRSSPRCPRDADRPELPQLPRIGPSSDLPHDALGDAIRDAGVPIITSQSSAAMIRSLSSCQRCLARVVVVC